ncbi:S8 family serine peptidase [Actinoplanes sp. TBRC 11911]|uniref:S8 family serine peptidase n=1 Tax=Actinoplanes sp. TBRC 11911 TaxID=2729386 RepID=UPI00145FAE5D|nr:S8 family serine peptidase [Actinoplanes sp. TBRC 11911]NMO50769.1 S8 family serine peptidase [Actinoplanes sp. TBRC 11911]
MSPPSPRITAVFAGVLLGAAALSPTAAAATVKPAGPIAVTGQSVTLITGDVVSLSPAGDGRFAASVRPGPGRANINFQTIETKDGVRVIPADAVPMLADGRLDMELFDVRHLIDEGYGDAASATLPLIVQSPAGLSTMRVSDSTALPSIGAVAVRPGKDSLAAFWRTQANARVAATQKIWLDGKVTAALDGSAEQIGAPAAWQAGLDGTGVTVAVLDTGIDATHPDVAGKIVGEKDFSDSPDIADHVGHGTHVASTVAAAGAHPGVAPGAKLLIGKVLDDTGSGLESGIIEGMQWAADQGARVVNMSLGGDPTDGTDPLAAAVNEISASKGTLFVIAAGNSGADNTIGSPGSAASALTVGAVDGDDALADFSSRGPRVGDHGLKPEITAPGVGIVAARAAGTTMGDPVDDLYTSASGTSMATPHVAGAAAILAQQHPSWTGAQLKNALVSTAKTVAGTSVYGQGAGRVDVARAVTQRVTATGVADFGLRAVGEKANTRAVTYTNFSEKSVTLSLQDDLAAVAPDVATVTIPAGGSTNVTLTFDPGKSDQGQFGGWLTATGPDGIRLTTAIGGTLDLPHRKVTLSAVDRDGNPADVPVLLMFGDDPRFDVLGSMFAGQHPVLEVTEGDYLLNASIGTATEDTLVTMPELHVDHDISVVLDARKANPVTIETPKPAETRTVLSYYTYRVLGSGRAIANGYQDASNIQRLNVTPTGKVRRGSFEFSSRWQLAAPLSEATVAGAAVPLRLMNNSPVFQGTKRFDLVAGLGGGVRGKAVVLRAGPDADEYSLVAAAAEAGAAVAVVVREPGIPAVSAWTPAGERLGTVALVVTHDEGQRLLTKRGSLTLTLTPNTPYLYDVFQVAHDRVPQHIVYRVTAANSQRITARYADNGGLDWAKEQRFGWRPWQDYAWNDTDRYVRTPSVREEWVSTGDTIWQHQVHHAYPENFIGGPLDGGVVEEPVSYRTAGTSTDTWYGPVVRPAGSGSTRTGNVLNLRIAQYVDGTGKHSLIRPVGGDSTASARLYRNGTLLTALPDAWQDVTVPRGDAAYRLTLSTSRGGAEWIYGTSTTTEWSFRSARSGSLPLLQISYAAPVALDGTATSRAHLLGVSVPGAHSVRVEVSSDAGAHWTTAPAVGSKFLVPAGHGKVSLRVTADDRAGDSVRQTVLSAYGRS